MNAPIDIAAASAARERRKGILALLGVQICFALNPVFGKWAFHGGAFAPLAVAAWRVAVGAIVLGVLAALRARGAFWPRRADLPRFVACSLLGVAVNQALFLEGLQRSTAVNAALIMCMIPVFTYAIAVALRQEPFSGPRALGIGLALAGALPLFVERGGSLVGPHALGNALLMSNALCYSAYLVLSKPLTRGYPSLTVVAWVFLCSTPALLWFGAGVRWVAPLEGNGRAWGAVAFIVLFPTILAYLWNAYALARVRASTAAFFVFVQPAVTAAAGWFLLGEAITRSMLLAAALVLPGLWLVVVRRR